VIWRINGVLLLLASALVVGLPVAGGIASLVGSSHHEEATPMAEVPERGESLFLGRVEPMDGTPYVLLPLHAGELSGRFDTKAFSSGSSEGETRNLLFHDVEKGTSRWLLPEQTTVIRDYTLLREEVKVPHHQPAREPEEAPVRWLRYELEPVRRPGQTERGDGALRLAVSGPAGDDLAFVLEGVDEVLGYGPLRATRQVVFFRRGREHFLGELDYATRKPVQGRPILKP
jgi:hypothetical protein